MAGEGGVAKGSGREQRMLRRWEMAAKFDLCHCRMVALVRGGVWRTSKARTCGMVSDHGGHLSRVQDHSLLSVSSRPLRRANDPMAWCPFCATSSQHPT